MPWAGPRAADAYHQKRKVDLAEVKDYTDALRQLGRFLDEVYEYKRIHSSLGYLTPAGFEDQ